MSRHAAESHVSTFENGLSMFALAATAGIASARADKARRIAHGAQCEAAAASATGEVLQESIADLRERLADAQAEADALRAQVTALSADLKSERAYAQELEAALDLPLAA
jgi:chromosome segregation ATPase